jgi:hypothetical protein
VKKSRGTQLTLSGVNASDKYGAVREVVERGGPEIQVSTPQVASHCIGCLHVHSSASMTVGCLLPWPSVCVLPDDVRGRKNSREGWGCLTLALALALA